nr:TPA_asm: polyprotein [Welwitschia mirabilis virus 2]
MTGVHSLHELVEQSELWFDREKQEICFPERKKSDLYNVDGYKERMMQHIKQSEVHLDITGEGLRPAFLPFFSKKDIDEWKKKKYHSVHLGEIDLVVHPKFNYDIGVEYMVTLLDVRHYDWNKARIGQFRGKLDKDAVCCIQPNFQLSLNDPHICHALVACIEMKDIKMMPESVYCSIGSRCIFNLTSSMFMNSRLPQGVHYPVGSRNLLEKGVHINADGFKTDYPIIQAMLNGEQEFTRHRIEEKKRSPLLSTKPAKHAKRTGLIHLSTSEPSIRSVEPKVDSICIGEINFLDGIDIEDVLVAMQENNSKKDYYSDNEDSYSSEEEEYDDYTEYEDEYTEFEDEMEMVTSGSDKAESSKLPWEIIGPNAWPPKKNFGISNDPKRQLRADCSHLLEHSVQDKVDQKDEVRQLNYLISWTDQASKKIDGIQSSLDLIENQSQQTYSSISERSSRKKDKKKYISQETSRWEESTILPVQQGTSIFTKPAAISQEDIFKSIQKGKQPSTDFSNCKQMMCEDDFFDTESSEINMMRGGRATPRRRRQSPTRGRRRRYVVPDAQDESLKERNLPGIPVLNIDNVELEDLLQVVLSWANEIYFFVNVNQISERECIEVATMRFSGTLKDWWFNADAQQKTHALNQGITFVAGAILAEFGDAQTQRLKQQRIQAILQRKLTSLDRFEEYSRDYITDLYKYGLNYDVTFKHAYLASLPHSLQGIVTKQMEAENLAIERIAFAALVNLTRRCIMDSCLHRAVQKGTKDIPLTAARNIQGGKWIPLASSSKKYKYRYRPVSKRKRWKPFRYARRKTKPRRKVICWACKKEGHYANRCPRKSPRAVRYLDMLDNYEIIQDQAELDWALESGREVIEFDYEEMTETERDSSSEFQPESPSKESSANEVRLEEHKDDREDQEGMGETKSPELEVDKIIKETKELKSVIIPVRVGKRNYQALVDTGATSNFAKKEITDKWIQIPHPYVVNTMNGSKEIHLIAKDVEIFIEGRRLVTDFLNIEPSHHKIGIGMYLLKQLQPVTIFSNRLQFYYKGKPYTVLRQERESSRNAYLIQQKDEQIEKRLKECCIHHPLEKWDRHQMHAEIPLIHNMAVSSPMIRMSEDDNEEIRNQIQELLQKGLIEESNSQYSFGAFIVRNHSEEKRGKARMVINYKPLNSITYDFKWPMQDKLTLLNTVAQAKIFSKFDCKSGYHQVKILPSDCHKTAFMTKEGLYQWKVMPFGLKNAPAIFQWQMDKIFQPYRKFIANYIDDFLIYSKNYDEHIQHLEIFADVCSRKGIGLSEDPKKFQVCQNKIEFLGMELEGGHLKLQPHISTKISQYPDNLRSEKECQRFLGLLNYARDFIPRLTQKTVNIRKCLVSKPFLWTIEAQKEVERLKIEAKNFPELVPAYEGPYSLCTDASDNYWGAVLSKKDKRIMESDKDADKKYGHKAKEKSLDKRQGESDEDADRKRGNKAKEKVIRYLSGQFAENERKWPIHDKEMLALVLSIEKLYPFLIESEFEIRTDSKAVVGLLKDVKNRNPVRCKFAWWTLVLQNYKYTVKHVQGKHNLLADFLSREGAEEEEAIQLVEDMSIQVSADKAVNIREAGEDPYRGKPWKLVRTPSFTNLRLSDLQRASLRTLLELSGWKLRSKKIICHMVAEDETLPENMDIMEQATQNCIWNVELQLRQHFQVHTNWFKYTNLGSTIYIGDNQRVTADWFGWPNFKRQQAYTVTKICWLDGPYKSIRWGEESMEFPKGWGNFVAWWREYGYSPEKQDIEDSHWVKQYYPEHINEVDPFPLDFLYYSSQFKEEDKPEMGPLCRGYYLTTILDKDYERKAWYMYTYTGDLKAIDRTSYANSIPRSGIKPFTINAEKVTEWTKILYNLQALGIKFKPDYIPLKNVIGTPTSYDIRFPYSNDRTVKDKFIQQKETIDGQIRAAGKVSFTRRPSRVNETVQELIIWETMDEYHNEKVWDFHYLRWNQKYHRTSTNWMYHLRKSQFPPDPEYLPLFPEEYEETTEPVPEAPEGFEAGIADLTLYPGGEQEMPIPMRSIPDNVICSKCNEAGCEDCISNWLDIQNWLATYHTFPLQCSKDWSSTWINSMDEDTHEMRPWPTTEPGKARDKGKAPME